IGSAASSRRPAGPAPRREPRAGSHPGWSWLLPRTTPPWRPASTSASLLVPQCQVFPGLRRLQLLEALLDVQRDLVASADARRIPPPRGQLGSTLVEPL